MKNEAVKKVIAAQAKTRMFFVIQLLPKANIFYKIELGRNAKGREVE